MIKTETLFTDFLVKHNMSFALADHFSKIFPKMFPDSKIAKKYGAGKTKVTQIVKCALAPNCTEQVVQQCKSSPFSLMCDESNDLNSDKLLVILVRGYDEAILKVTTRFLDMPTCNVGTAEKIFGHVEDTVNSHQIPWANLLAYNSDNCSVMKGSRNSVLSRLLEKQPKMVNMGCICHLTNLVTAAGVKKIPYPIDDLLVDIFYHFHHSSKRKEEYKEFATFCEVDPLKLLKHCQTRWLSLLRCVNRTLQQWPALQSYFTSHCDVERAGRVKRIEKLLCNPEVKLYFYFAKFLLKPLADFNIIFQTEGPKVLSLYPEMVRLIKKVLSFFLSTTRIKDASGDLRKLVFKGAVHQLSDDDLNIGSEARAYLLEKEEDEFDAGAILKFYKTVRLIYEAVIDKIMKCFPLDDELLKTLWVLQPSFRNEASSKQVIFLAEQLPQLVSPTLYDELREEFADYQLMDDRETPRKNLLICSGESLGR